MTTLRTCEMYAQRAESGRLTTFLHTPIHHVCCGNDPIVHVRVTEDNAGDYWAWWDAEREDFNYCNTHRGGVAICFPYGPEAEEARGRGKLMRVRVDELADVSREEARAMHGKARRTKT